VADVKSLSKIRNTNRYAERL